MKTFMEVAKPVKDPGVYMCAKFDQASQEALKRVQETLGGDNHVSPNKLHTTIVYSRKTVDLFPRKEMVESVRLVDIEKWDTKYGSTIVGLLESDYLHSRFNDAIDMGATYDFEDYKPHVTLAYDSNIDDITGVKRLLTLPVELCIIEEQSESLDLDKTVDSITEINFIMDM